MSRKDILHTTMKAVSHRLTDAQLQLRQALESNHPGIAPFWEQEIKEYEEAYQWLLELLQEEFRT